MKPAIFLDRDGVLCEERSYITSLEQMKIFPYTKKSIEQIHQKGFLAICITNQSAVARGLMAETELGKIHDYLVKQTGLDALYYCPHYSNGMGIYTCTCRKPGIGLIEKAVKEWKIDLTHSYMVGDRASDIMCGKNAGIKTILLESGYGTKGLEQDVEADAVYEDLLEFTQCLDKVSC